MRPERHIHLLLEGQTEEAVAAGLLQPHLESVGWWVTRSVLITRRPIKGPARRGGLSSWAKLRGEIDRLLRGQHIDTLTTVIDYYGLPVDTPGMADRPAGAALQRVVHVENAISAVVGNPRFVPHLTMHETEAWVYAAASQLGELMASPRLARTLQAESGAAGGPELVNDGPHTAPSKRLLAHWPAYDKVTDGPLAIGELGLPALRRQCPHLDGWLRRFEE